MLSFARAGCQLAQRDLLIDHRQREIDLQFFSLGAACQAVRAATSAASDATALRKLGSPWVSEVHWRPVLAVLSRTSELWTRRHKNAFRSVNCGARWSQARLHAKGKAVHPFCARCGARGTLWHRCSDCPAAEFPRRDFCPPELLQAAKVVEREGEQCAELFARGLLPSPVRAFQECDIPEEDRIRFVGCMPGWLFEGEVFVDGSAFLFKMADCAVLGGQ